MSVGYEHVLLIPGFVCGAFMWVQFLRWLALIHVSVSKQGGDFLGPPKRRLLWATPFVATMHPSPWLLGGIAIAGFRSMGDSSATYAHWFFGGFFAGIALQAYVALQFMRRSRPRA